MTTFRRIAPLLSMLLVALVVVQTTDLVACADEAAAATHVDGYHVDGAVPAGAHPTPSPGGNHDEGRTHEEAPGMADCLCHVVFAPTGFVPAVASSPAAEPAAYAGHLTLHGSAHAKPLDHVPLA